MKLYRINTYVFCLGEMGEGQLNICLFSLILFYRFEDDIQYMLGFRPHMYWKICWRYVSPVLITVIFVASLVNLAINPMQYSAWDAVNVSLGFVSFTAVILLI